MQSCFIPGLGNNSRPHGPLSYPSQKCVLEHIEANTRFLLAIHCPCLRVIEKDVPLHIDWLSLMSYSTSINESRYHFGIHRYLEDRPTFFKARNDDGGSAFDLDHFGREDYEAENSITPGDIITSNPHVLLRNRDEAQWTEYVRKSYKRLNELKKMEDSPEIKLEKEKLQVAMYPAKFVRNGTPAPFKTFVQLIVLKDDEIWRIELVDCKTKILEAKKYLMTKFLGERSVPIRVKTLNINQNNHVIRLPLGVKFCIKSIFTTGHVAHIMSAPIFDLSIFQTINIRVDHPFNLVENHEHPIIQNAAFVVLCPMDNRTIENLFEIVLKYHNKSLVEVTTCSFSVAQYLNLVDMLIREPQKFGTMYSFGTPELNILEEVIVELSQRPNVEVLTEKRFIILRISPTSELLFYVDKSKKIIGNWVLSIIVGKRPEAAESYYRAVQNRFQEQI